MSASTTILAFVLVAPGFQARELQSAAPDQACACRIVLRRVAQLGRLEDTIAIVRSSVVDRDSRGRYFVAPILPYGAVATFDSTGRFLSVVGRRGAGPGELGRVRHAVVTPGDSLIAYDQNRLVLFDPDGRHVRTASVAAAPRGFWFVVVQGRVVINNYLPTHPAIVVVNSDFSYGRSFGKSVSGGRLGPDELRLADSNELLARFAELGRGRFAVIYQNYRFHMQIWDTAGTMHREFTRAPPWFTAWSREAGRARASGTPFPYVVGAAADSGGRLVWITALVPDRTWKAPPVPLRRGAEGPALVVLTPAQRARAYDTVMELRDAETARVLVSQRFDAVVDGVMPGGFYYSHREDANGILVIDVWRAEVQQVSR